MDNWWMYVRVCVCVCVYVSVCVGVCVCACVWYSNESTGLQTCPSNPASNLLHLTNAHRISVAHEATAPVVVTAAAVVLLLLLVLLSPQTAWSRWCPSRTWTCPSACP